MKIAIIGNMNNCGFSIMRYFRDLGFDAHLLLFANDGKGVFSHFSVDADTRYIDKWKPFIHRTKIGTGYHAIVGFPKKFQLPISKKKIEKLLAEYDYIIGSGMMPAVLSKTNRDLDIFFPYSIGIEYVGSISVTSRIERGTFPIKLLTRYARKEQINGIKKSKYCLNAEMSLTKDVFDELKVKFLPLAVPMLYNKEKVDEENLSSILKNILFKIRQYDFKILSHARHYWINNNEFSTKEWFSYTKNNDWLIKGFAKIVKDNKYKNPLLILLEYGQDVESSKQLCHSLNITENVLWLKTMSRKDIMVILSVCDMGVGEFYNDKKVLWGGTGWEVLASGKPLLQSFRFEKNEYEKMFNHIAPSFLNVLEEKDIYTHIQDMIDNPQKCHDLGESSKSWFNKYNGINLAQKWIDILIGKTESE